MSPLTPTIIVCDHEKDLAERLLAALRDAHGTRPRIFVKDHATRPETLVVLLPHGGPSLAAALRDWVDTWWSDEDDATYGAPNHYLAGFDVWIPEPGVCAPFSPSCPYCGARDALMVRAGSFMAAEMSLTPHGFAVTDAQAFDTAQEQVQCEACSTVFTLDEVRL